MELIPTTYHCPDHGKDLTELVRDQLADQIPVAYRRRPRPFRVLITCPGTGQPHQLACTGQVTY